MATQNYVRKKTAISLTDRKRARLLKNLAIAKLPPKDHSDKGADEEIKTIKQQMEFILGVTKTGLDIIDSEFNIRYINTEWANKVYGNPTGKKCYEYFRGRSEVCPNCGIPQALKTKTIVVTEGELAKEGNRPIQVTTIPFKNSNGEWLVAEVNVDISERKRIEEGLRKAQEELEIRIQGRTVELAHANEAMLVEIIERKRAEEALKRSEESAKQMAQENSIMAEIGRIISSTLNIEEVYERFAEEVHKLIPFDRVSVNVINPDHTSITIIYAFGIKVGDIKEGDVLPLDDPFNEKIVKSRQGILIHLKDERELAKSYPNLVPHFQAGIRSMITVPLISKNQVIGLLHFQSLKPNSYTELDLNLAERVGNQISGAIANAQLFADHIKAEEALKKSEERFRDLFDDAPIGYHEFYHGGRITRVNRTELEMLGYTEEEMLGRYAWDFIVEKVSPELVREKLDSVKLQPGRIFERTFRRKDGTTFPALIHERFFRDDEGQITSIRSAIQDITERKRTEEQMNHLQEQLRQSQKMEAIGRLAGGIAHDFNNLMTIIKGYSQLSLLDLKENDPLRENIHEIQTATERATNLTRQLLAFSRRQILEPKVLDLNSLLKDLDKMLRRIIGEDIDMTLLLANDLWRVKIDPGQLEQVILNLAVNAKDAMPTGGKLSIETVNVELDEEYAHAHIGIIPGRYVMLSITDTGVGMPQEVKEKIFEPFFTTKNIGTGLGLSTVHGIVHQSGGNIWVYSEPGHGTTFKIYLPKVEEELDTLQRREETDSSPRGSETVLLVEDDQSVRSLAYRLLHQQGYTILEAANGEEALRVVQEHAGEKIHLLFTDVVMPYMNGKELADQLQLLRPDIKVLYTSGYTDNAIVHFGVLNQNISILQKPFSHQSLSQKVREVLDQ